MGLRISQQDISDMSTEDLMKLQGQLQQQKAAQPPAMDLSSLSTEQLMEIQSSKDPAAALQKAQTPEKSLGEQALEMVIEAGRFVDKYTGAPTRAAIEELIPTMPPLPGPKQPKGIPQGSQFFGTDVGPSRGFGEGSVVGAVKAFSEQFGEDPSKAPSGKQLAQMMGASPEETLGVPFTDFKFSPAGIGGLTIEILADPLNLIPFSAAGKVLSKTAAKGAQAAKAVGTTAKRAVKAAPGVKPTIKTVDVVSDVVKRKLDDIIKPTQAKNFDKMKSVAAKHGIDPATLPDQIEFGAESALGQLSRSMAETDIHGELAKKFMASLDNTSQALENSVRKIGGVAEPLDTVGAGDLILDGVQKSFDSLFGDFSVTYKQLTDRLPGLRLADDAADSMYDKLETILTSAERRKRIASIGAEASQAEQVAGNIYSILALGDNMDDLVVKLHSIGNAGYVSKFARGLEVAPDEKAFRQIYDVLKDAIIDSVQKVDPQIADDLIDTNKNISDFLKARQPIEGILTNGRVAPENVFRRLVSNGDSKQIQALKEVLPAQEFSKLKSTYLNDLIKYHPEDGYVQFAQTGNLFKNPRNKLRIAQILEPDELAEFTELISLGRNHGSMILNPSGTSRSQFFRNIKENVGKLVENDVVLNFLRQQARKPRAPTGLLPPMAQTPAPAGLAVPRRGMGLGRLPITTPLLPARVGGIENELER